MIRGAQLSKQKSTQLVRCVCVCVVYTKQRLEEYAQKEKSKAGQTETGTAEMERQAEKMWKPRFPFSAHTASVLSERLCCRWYGRSRQRIRDDKDRQGWRSHGGTTPTVWKQLLNDTVNSPHHTAHQHLHILSISRSYARTLTYRRTTGHTNEYECFLPRWVDSELLWGPLSKRQVYQSAACLLIQWKSIKQKKI